MAQRLGYESEIREHGTAKITFLDANHCPGARLVLVQLPCGRTHLHTRDMRYCEEMKAYPLLREITEKRKLDLVYLDTTYSHPKHNLNGRSNAARKKVLDVHVRCDVVAEPFTEGNTDLGLLPHVLSLMGINFFASGGCARGSLGARSRQVGRGRRGRSARRTTSPLLTLTISTAFAFEADV